MQLDEAIRRRRMCRHFLESPVPPEVIDRLLERAVQAPSAGHTQGWGFLVLEGRVQTERFWSTDADPAWLRRPDHPGVLLAPVIVVPFCNSQAYVDRYARSDKSGSGLAGLDAVAWPAPYWLIDTAFFPSGRNATDFTRSSLPPKERMATCFSTSQTVAVPLPKVASN